MNKSDISKKLDIYDPFLMVDNIKIDLSLKKANSSKFLNPNEWFFKSHIPKEKIMPATLIIEGMLQSSALLIYECLEHKSHKTYIVDIKTKIFSKVIPIDKCINYETILISSKRGISKTEVKVFTDNKKKAEGFFTYASPDYFIDLKQSVN